MNKELFDGFDEIKSDRFFKDKLKSEMLRTLHSSRPQPKRRRAALIAIPALAAAVALAVVLPNAAGNRFVLAAKAQDLMQGVKARQVDVSDAVTQSFIQSTQAFSVRLFQTQYAVGKNNLVSPASACFCLGMAANGAGGTTRTEFLNVLGKYGLTMDGLNRAYKAYADELASKHGSTDMILSNSIWLRTGLKVEKNFLQDNADYFGAGAHTLDFNDAAVRAINSWVKSNTKGRIDGLVDRIDPNAEMFLANALAFDAKWKYPFDTDGPSTKDNFTLENGKTVQMDFMSLTASLGYIQGEKETAVVLPYDDGRFAMLCILPKEGTNLKDYVKGMSENTISDLMERKTDTSVSVRLPRFQLTADENLNRTLSQMGLSGAFGDSADFSGMTGDRSLYISNVRQKTFLEVDELGTKAAAATDAEMETKGIILGEHINLNRPFVFAIIDLKTNLPLFIGTKQE